MAGPDGSTADGGGADVDVLVVGAGMAGLYLLHRLRQLGWSAKAVEAADDVGGTWYWNRYPGARCDVKSIDYSYSFDPELDEEWHWSEKYATQPEILRYLQHVADRHDLRRDIEFSTRVVAASWDEAAGRWTVRTDRGSEVRCRFYVMATGCLSVPKSLDIAGAERFAGPVYNTGRWPHEGVDFTGKRVGVIGTGSSGIQSIPLIAEQAATVTVFQRTPNFSFPAWNGPVPAAKLAAIEGRRAEYREEARHSAGGVPWPVPTVGALQVSPEERRARYEELWAAGELFAIGTAFNDTSVDLVANETLAEFVRDKIRSIVNDPETAETLCPKDHPIGTKRPCLDTDYYATYNLPHVRLVDLRTNPITTITEDGVVTATESFEFDALVLATGFDAMTGAIVAVDITGSDGVTLKEKWAQGPRTYLGLMTAAFPNLFFVTGPGSPSVLSNMVVSIEQHVEWICDCLEHLRANDLDTIEPSVSAEDGWVRHVNDYGAITLLPRANSWYMGANVPGKARVFLPYVGGVGRYRSTCDEVVERDYLGFAFTGADGTRCNDGVIRTLQPDVAIMLETMGALDLPPLDTMSVDDARAFSKAAEEVRRPGPAVGEVTDGELPGPAGAVPYRLYRPATAGPHPIVVYFHGGGWVLGSLDSDDPFCRDLCVRSDAIVVSVDYRHAPEHRFPAAPDDAFAAVRWVSAHVEALGGSGDAIAVAGWSAGANVAAVACQRARDAGGPAIAAQLLVTPVVDCDLDRPSYTANGEDYILTASLMRWFWDHYADPADRTNPAASPLLADDLSGLPPAIILTAEFDPLRDGGDAYAEALAAAGVEVRHIRCAGHIHTSLTAVDMIISGGPRREQAVEALRAVLTARIASR